MAPLRGGLGITPGSFTVSNGTLSKVITVNPSMNVESLLNQINSAGLGVKAQINDAGTGIDVLNTVQGATLTISENGGTTASDLGLRSFTPATTLAQLNGGKGVGTVSGNDFSVTTADGTVTNVDLNNPQDVQAVLNQINAAAGGKFTAGFATTGNGIVLTDNTTGGGTLTVTPLNFSTAAADLGLTASPASGGVITGKDVNGVSTPGIFSGLQKLRDALRSNDTSGITAAAEGLKSESDNVVVLRGTTGARVQELTTRSNRIDDENIATKALLSQLQDADMTQTITQFQTLQNSLQATLQTTAKTLNMSLLDYLG
jgi:flagellar hook-associated protein 3 FlgL